MIDFLKTLILGNTSNSEVEQSGDDERRVQIATCALFLELAHSDDEFTIEEEDFIKSIMKKKFELDDQTVNELIELSIQQTEKSVSIYEFTDIINQHFNNASKFRVLKNLWRLVYADGKLDKYEEYFMRKVSGNLKMEHSDMISSKMEIETELGI